MSSFEKSLKQLPKPILNKLHEVIRHVRRLQWFRGICATLAVGLVCLLLIMAVDALVTLFSYRARWALSLTGLVFTTLTGWCFLIRPLSKKITLSQVARALEERHPELQERISTAVELLSSDDPDEIKGSQELIEEVVNSAIADINTIKPRKEFNTGKAHKFLVTGFVCLGIFAAVFWFFPKQGSALLKRAVAPSGNIGNAYAGTLVVNPGNSRIVKGSNVSITMTVSHNRLKRAEIRRTLSNGKESTERMTLLGRTDQGHQQFSITFNNVEEDFQYRIRAGVALSKYYTIQSVSPPAIMDQSVEYQFPDYTNLQPKHQSSFDGTVNALAYTKVTITSIADKPVGNAAMIINNNQIFGKTSFDKYQIISSFTLTPATSGVWNLRVIDQDGFESDATNHSIDAVVDQNPSITITNPITKELTLRPVEVVPISYQATEDYGFSELVVVANVAGENEPRIFTQPLPIRTDTGGWQGQVTVNLADLNLNELNRVVTVQLRARDNRPMNFSGPGEVHSDSITLYIKQQAKSLAEQVIESQKKEIEQTLRYTRDKLKKARSRINHVKRDIEGRSVFSQKAKNYLDDFLDETKITSAKLKEVTNKLTQSVFSQEAARLEKIADEEIEQARNSAGRVAVLDSPEQRQRDAERAEKKINQALSKLLDIEESIRKKRDDLEKIVKLNEMANNQRQLAQEAAQLLEQDQLRQRRIDQIDNQQLKGNLERQRQQSLQEFQQQQAKLVDEFGNLVERTPLALRETLINQKQKAQQLAKQAIQPSLQNKVESEQLAKSAEQLQKSLNSLSQRQAGYSAAHAKDSFNDSAKQTDKQQVLESLKSGAESLIASAKQIDRSLKDLEKTESGQESATIDTKQMADSFDKLSAVEHANDATETAKKAKQAAQSIQNLAEKAMDDLGQIGGQTPNQDMASASPEKMAALVQLQDIQKQQEQLADDAKRQAEQDEARHLQNAQTTDPKSREKLEQESIQKLEQFGERQNQIKDQLSDLLNHSNEELNREESLSDRNQAEASNDTGNRPFEPEDIAKVFQEIEKSAQSKNANEAAKNAEQINQNLKQMTEQAIQELGKPSGPMQQGKTKNQLNFLSENPNKQPGENYTNGIPSDAQVPPELEKLGITSGDWARFKGFLANGGTVSASSNVPEEYRDLVARYFSILSTKATNK